MGSRGMPRRRAQARPLFRFVVSLQMYRATQGILDVARGVLADLDLEVVLDRVLIAAQQLTDARYAAIGVLNDQRTELSRFLTSGVDDAAREAIGGLPRGRGVLGVLISDPKPLRLSDVGEHPASYGFPPGHPPMAAFLGVPIMIDGEPYGNLYLAEKDGGAEFTSDDEDALCVLADFAGVAIDHARRYTAARKQQEELSRTVAALEATLQIARAVGGETDPDVVLRLVAKRARALVSARSLLIELWRGEELEVAAGAGELPEGIIGRRVPAAGTVAAQAGRTQSLQRLSNQLNRARFSEHGVGHLGVRAQDGIVVPLIFRGQSHGVLVALDRLDDGPGFSDDDETLLQSFAVSAATAVATAQAVTAERHRHRLAAAEAERQRWARELHDDTLQGLSAVRINLSAARRSPESLAGAVGDAIDRLEESIANLRALITDLRPAALDQLGAKAAIEALAERNEREDVQIDVSIELDFERGTRPTRLTPEVETALYRIVQEAVTNTIKHGRAKRAVIEVCERATAVELVVRDDGRGFDADAPADGFGLLGMRERVALLGGELEIRSAAGQGTTVKARMPNAHRLPESAGTVDGRVTSG